MTDNTKTTEATLDDLPVWVGDCGHEKEDWTAEGGGIVCSDEMWCPGKVPDPTRIRALLELVEAAKTWQVAWDAAIDAGFNSDYESAEMHEAWRERLIEVDDGIRNALATLEGEG